MVIEENLNDEQWAKMQQHTNNILRRRNQALEMSRDEHEIDNMSAPYAQQKKKS